MSFECKYCKRKFTTQGNLVKHQKTTKFCLKIQNEMNSEETVIISYGCVYCKKEFTSNHHLNNHQNNCIEKFKKDIVDLNDIINQKDKERNEEIDKLSQQLSEAEDRIQDLENQLKTIRLEVENEIIKERNVKLESTVEEIAKQPKNQINNTSNKIIIATPLDLSNQKVQEAIQNGFSHEHLTMGQKGVGKLKYICTDPSRQVFQYKNEEGKIQKDVRATKLTKALLEADIKQTSHKIAWDNMKDGDNVIFMEYTNYYQDIQALEQDNGEFSKELSCLAI
jgi:hypothetical protein